MIPPAPSRPETLRALGSDMRQLLAYVEQMADLLGSTSQIAEEARIRMPAWRALAHSALAEGPQAPLDVDLSGDWNVHMDAVKVALDGPTAGPQSPSGWQPIETAPKDGTRVLVVGEGNRWQLGPIVARMLSDYDGWYSLPGKHYVQPTLWQPLPASPSASTEQK